MAKWIEDPQGRLEVEKVTEELKLPVWKANYKGKFREFWNECWEKIEDSFLKIKKSNEGKEPAITTKETAFNKPFGVSEDTVLEGNKFTQMTGKDYGGILNITGQKEAGKAYWDNNTKKLYICKNNNSDISPNVNNYIPFDSNSLLERLENLNTKLNGDIASVTSFRLGFNTSNVLNTSKIKDKKIIYVTVRSDNMHISCQLPKNISRAMLVHGTNARTAILSIEDTGFWLYGDITGINGIFLSEYVYA